LLNHLITRIQDIDYAPLLAAAEEKYGVKEFKIAQITPINAFEIYNSVYTKYIPVYVGPRRIMLPILNSIGGKTN
jgi:hypothetical protein